MNVKSSDALPPAEVVRQRLGHYLGPFTAKNAVNLGAKQIKAADADAVTLAQVPALIEALGPTLRILLGKDAAEKVAREIRQELSI
jgi:hypothetical protein